MRKLVKIVGFILVLGLVFVAGTSVGWRYGKTKFEELFVGEVATEVRNAVSTAATLRQAGSQVYLPESEALLLLHVTELGRFSGKEQAKQTAFRLAKTYYEVFRIPIPDSARPLLEHIPTMPAQEFHRITDLPVVELVRDHISGAVTK